MIIAWAGPSLGTAGSSQGKRLGDAGPRQGFSGWDFKVVKTSVLQELRNDCKLEETGPRLMMNAVFL